MDVAVVAFEDNRFNGEIMPALRELRENGTVRVLDLTSSRHDRSSFPGSVERGDGPLDGTDRSAFSGWGRGGNCQAAPGAPMVL
ncbi:hypothetical protein AB0P15_33555 [Streptomyces sp. NPDC087917]|uniref:hypothetical protein n=1 Tax=unclassified Streptomyces TaxID=2593676 RepID=UPI00343591D7